MPTDAALSQDVSLAVHTDAPTLGGTLARAFQDDPVLEWVIPDQHNRRARLPQVFRLFVDVYLVHQETYVVGQGVGGALWAPPGAEPVPRERAEDFGDALASAVSEDADRVAEINALLEERHPADPCFYLQFMGIAPEHQGRGLGSRLLATVLQRCDATRAPAYLEATSPDNRRLYARHGFVTVGEITLPQGPSLWPMWREPEPQRA